MRTKDGLVHLVEVPQSFDFKGILRCGILFSSDVEFRAKWIPKGRPRVGNTSVVAVRTGKKPTCLWCVVGGR